MTPNDLTAAPDDVFARVLAGIESRPADVMSHHTVEAAAKAMWAVTYPRTPWEHADYDEQDAYRAEAAAALGSLPAPTDRLAEAVRELADELAELARSEWAAHQRSPDEYRAGRAGGADEAAERLRALLAAQEQR